MGAVKKCGTCTHWLKKRICPKEKGIMVSGPTSESSPCEKYDLDWRYKIKEPSNDPAK